jgi:hypothetical protein
MHYGETTAFREAVAFDLRVLDGGNRLFRNVGA